MRKAIEKQFKKKNVRIASLCVSFCGCLLGGVLALNTQTATAMQADSVSLESDTDKFLLTDTGYTSEESFVYTAKVEFATGQAAGLVFSGDDNTQTYWVFNMDRAENRVKLMYFCVGEDGNLGATVLLEDYFIGNDKMTDGEKSKVEPKVASLDTVWLKVVISYEEDGVWGEFFADGIRRFGVDKAILLSGDSEGSNAATEDDNTILTTGDCVYAGGKIGYNCFNSSVQFSEIYYAESDYSYYTETYRQQYHFSQFAHWNNDPNGLVYYDGWYHLYYQHHPFSNYWSDIYWGHARSKDLAHWELLPICLFPDTARDGFGDGDGYMWSGSAMVYHKGMSEAIDEKDWFANGNGDGLIAFYTRDGATQDQVVMTSDDGGMTWTKRVRIPQTTATQNITQKTDCRDPKVFPVKQDSASVTVWGMALTGMETNNVWFLKSTDLLNWSYAGGFSAESPECPDVVSLTADDGSTKTVMTFTGRKYLVGEIRYNESTEKIEFIDLDGNDVSTLSTAEIPFQTMDYGVDSYATQSYYIDDKNSAYYGKIVSISWYSGVPNSSNSIDSGALSVLRKTWNGGGMTIPVELGLKKTKAGYILTQTPIVKDSAAFTKTNKITLTNTTLTSETENPLKNVSSRDFEMSVSIQNPNLADVAIRIGVGTEEYTEIGWTKETGYYVDRSHTYDGGLIMNNYHRKYAAGVSVGVSAETAESADKIGTVLTFYILVDNGGVEVYCDDFSIPFYILTFISPYSRSMSILTDGDITIENLSVNEISSVWREEMDTDEAVLYVSADSIELSTLLTNSKTLSAYSSNDGEISWSLLEGADIIAMEVSENTATITAKKAGNAQVQVSCGKEKKIISVVVHSGTADSDISLTNGKIISGDWLMTEDGLVGVQVSGDGFLLSENSGTDFTYAAKFNLNGGTAAALIFRATEDMSDYYIANYDDAGHVVKLWTPQGELGNVSIIADPANVYLSVTAKGNNITVSLDGKTLIDIIDDREDARTSGLFGLNVCAARVNFFAVGLEQSAYEYTGDGQLIAKSAIELAIYEAYNDTLGVKIPSAYYGVSGREITFEKEYFTFLNAGQTYVFTLKGRSGNYSFSVAVNSIPQITLTDLTIEEMTNATFFVGGYLITEVKVNGVLMADEMYSVQNGVLTINQSAFSVGENSVEILPVGTAKVKVNALPRTSKTAKESGCKSSINRKEIAMCIALSFGVVALSIGRRKRNGNDN